MHPFVLLNYQNDLDYAFTIAHELGHAVLHPKANTPFLRDNTLFSVSRLEREANCFAAELLCPDEVLLEYPGYTVGELARILGIREEALWACKGPN